MTKAPGMGGFQSPSICLTQDAKQLTEHSAPSCGFPDIKQGNKSALQLSSVTLELLLFLLAPPAEFLNAAGLGTMICQARDLLSFQNVSLSSDWGIWGWHLISPIPRTTVILC